MSTTSATAESSAVAAAVPLRNLYLVRFGFAVVWAILMFAVGASLGPVTVALLVLYPLFDVAAAVIDVRSSKVSRPAVGLYVNVALSLLTAIGLGIAVASGVPAVLRVWGAWAITAGVVQLVVAIGRYRLGGQWAMILSGGISVLAGASFIAMAGGPNAMLTSVAGYATLGGVFFLISALRLNRVAKKGA
ncbi:hypothetical protein [Myceligenerans pegani]|uniref:Integral membrane protein n=1 Tax=Myceligenerans pegani TaxID=2776917 RepID=A0ABR9MRX6_9MICO|nr:hypothetical protein [Myceligenerans sp. TRM 65318]MBE1874128.1 hypothetical protein [Myceligenerans sp. TRM 65318]MBE3016400.1 hypothetical protein [Myceligenerans sp. TRM 65318]